MQYLIKIIFFALLFMLPFTGCSTHKAPEKPESQKIVKAEPVKEKMEPKTMYVINETALFKRGEAVTVLSIEGKLAITDKGEITLSNLEEKRSTFTLSVITLKNATIKILNIKPKYHDGIWLKTGKYHIEVSKQGYKTHKQWIVLHRDKKINIKLKKQTLQANGLLTWKRGEESYSINGQIFQMQSANTVEKMTWEAAKEYCDGLNVSLYGFRADNFILPNDTELLQLYKATQTHNHPNAIYWTSSTDSEHQSYAKYVNINSGDSSWYKKHGKTYVLCQHKVDADLSLPLEKLAKSLMDNKVAHLSPAALQINEDASKNRRALNALEMALFLKYGNPIIQNVSYFTDDQVLSYELISQNDNSKGEPYFYKKIRVHIEDDDVDPESIKAQLIDPSFVPIIDFDVVNGKLIFLGM